ncbi:MAG: tetratricopeptide repeat protein [Bryobacteraceae bacterium]
MPRRPYRLLAVVLFLAPYLLAYAAEDEATAHVGKGYEFVQKEQYKEAVIEFQRAVEINPHLVRARYQLAACLFALGEREKSQRQFELLRKETAEDANVLYYLGRLHLLAGENGAALQIFRKIASNPPFADTSFYLGCAYIAEGDVSEAISALKRAQVSAPRDFRIPYRLARAYRQSGRITEAEREFQRSSALREGYNEAARESGECSQALRSHPIGEARAICERMADPNDPDKLTSLGIIYGEHGAYNEAIVPLERAAKLDPDSFEIFHNLGLSYFRLRRYPEARSALEKAVFLRPDFFGSNALLGAVLFALKEDELAYLVLVHASELEPSNADTAGLLFKVAMLLARDRFRAKDYTHSAEYLQKASEAQPLDASVHRRLAEIYNLLGEADLAREETGKADQMERVSR